MGLEDRLKERKEDYGKLNDVVEGLINSINDPNAPGPDMYKLELGKYVHDIEEAVDPETILEMPTNIVVEESKFYRANAQKEYINEVGSDVNGSLRLVEADNLIGKVIPNVVPYETGDDEHKRLAKKDKELRLYKRALKEQGLQVYIDLMGENIVKERFAFLAQTGGGGAMLSGFKRYIGRREKEFVEEFKVGDDVDRDKASGYIVENIEGAKDAENEGHEKQAYFSIGEAI